MSPLFLKGGLPFQATKQKAGLDCSQGNSVARQGEGGAAFTWPPCPHPSLPSCRPMSTSPIKHLSARQQMIALLHLTTILLLLLRSTDAATAASGYGTPCFDPRSTNFVTQCPSAGVCVANMCYHYPEYLNATVGDCLYNADCRSGQVCRGSACECMRLEPPRASRWLTMALI